jgi:hypothetical protein
MKEGPVTQFSHFSLALLKQRTEKMVDSIRRGQAGLSQMECAHLLEEWQYRLTSAVAQVKETIDQDFR